MKPVIFTPKALDDLEGIADYVAADNPERALTFVEDIERRCAAIARRPAAARSFPALGEDARVVPFRNYLIFYCDKADHVLIVRVLHGARDILPLVEDDASDPD